MWSTLSIVTDKVIIKMSMRSRVNILKYSMDSSQEIIEGRVAGIDR